MSRILTILFCFFLLACDRKGAVQHATQWRWVDGCSFSLRLPAAGKIKKKPIAENENPSNCNYRGTIDKLEVFDIYSAPLNQFEAQSIDTLYRMAVDYSKFTIQKKEQKGNWFAISGVHPETGNRIYWRRVVGRTFITDLYFDYTEEEAKEVESFVEGMAVSLVCE